MDPYRCVGCLSDHDRWRHQCQVCGRSGALVKLATLEEYEPESAPVQRPVKLVRTAADAPDIPEVRVSTGIDGLDRVLGGGMVSPGVILFAGAPGCGKSTILMPMIAGLTTTDRLYEAAEESDVRYRRRAVRCGLSDRLDDIPVLHTQDFNVIMDVIARANPRIVVIDSVNVLVDPVRDVPRETLYKSYTLGASHTEVIWNVIVRAVLPRLIDGIRLQIGPAMVYLIAAEMVCADLGFGYRIRLQSRLLNMNVVYPYIALLAAFGFVMDFSLRRLQRFVCPWRQEKGN